MVPVASYTNVAGIPVTELIAADRLAEIVQRTRDGGAEVVKLLKSGSAYYAPSAAVSEMVDSIVHDQKRVLPCAALLQGEYGLNGLFMGVPCRLGSAGLEQVLEITLNADEQAQLSARPTPCASSSASWASEHGRPRRPAQPAHRHRRPAEAAGRASRSSTASAGSSRSSSASSCCRSTPGHSTSARPGSARSRLSWRRARSRRSCASSGLTTAMFRFCWDHREPDAARRTIRTSFTAVMALSTIAVVLGLVALDPTAPGVLRSPASSR